MTDELLTVTQVAQQLQVSPQTVRNWLIDGRLPEVRVGPRRVRIRASDLEAFIGVQRSAESDKQDAAVVSVRPGSPIPTGNLTLEEVAGLSRFADLMLEWAARLDDSSRLGRELAAVAGRIKAMTLRLEARSDVSDH